MTDENTSPIFTDLMAAPEEHEVFAIVVEGEVALLIPAHKTNHAMYVAVWSSNPTVVKVGDNQKIDIRPGWTFDGTNFISPSE
jgi:hypothetical protein